MSCELSCLELTSDLAFVLGNYLIDGRLLILALLQDNRAYNLVNIIVLKVNLYAETAHKTLKIWRIVEGALASSNDH